MFGIGFFELLVIAVFALVFVGPKKLPEVMRQAGKFFVHMRRTANDVRSTFDQVVREAEDEIRREEAEHVKALLTGAPKPVTPVAPAFDKHVPPHNPDGTPVMPSETPAAQTGTPDGAKPYAPGAPTAGGNPLTHDATWHPVAQSAPDAPAATPAPAPTDTGSAAPTDHKDS